MALDKEADVEVNQEEYFTGATVKEAALLTHNSHCVQLKGFSPEWIRKCVLRLSAVVEE